MISEQNSPSSVIDPSTLARSVEKAKNAANYIKLIRHSSSCNGACRDPLCARTKVLLDHCLTCTAISHCLVAGCDQTKTLLSHVTMCDSVATGRGCLICSQVACPRDLSMPVVVPLRPRSASDLSDFARRPNVPIAQGHSSHLQKAREAARYIRLILHSQHCGGMCNEPMCQRTKALVVHCRTCTAAPLCTRTGCVQTKKLMEHVATCNSRSLGKACLICPQVNPAQNTSISSSEPRKRATSDFSEFVVPLPPKRFRVAPRA